MCTVTVLSRASLAASLASADPPRLRLACNRDEVLTRAAALAPSVRVVGERRVTMPVDPESGGTWIAASDAGLVFALLNINAATSSPGPLPRHGLSRGGLIPSLVGSGSVNEAFRLVLDAGADRYRPFRLLVMDSYQVVEFWLDGGRVRHRRADLHSAVMRTSSSLGDAVVARPRRALFRQLFTAPANAIAAQDAFHEHQWPGREPVSVHMRRDDARTVSHCVVELTASVATMTYRASGSRERSRVVMALAGAAPADVRRCS